MCLLHVFILRKIRHHHQGTSVKICLLLRDGGKEGLFKVFFSQPLGVDKAGGCPYAAPLCQGHQIITVMAPLQDLVLKQQIFEAAFLPGQKNTARFKQ